MTYFPVLSLESTKLFSVEILGVLNICLEMSSDFKYCNVLAHGQGWRQSKNLNHEVLDYYERYFNSFIEVFIDNNCSKNCKGHQSVVLQQCHARRYVLPPCNAEEM